jgi:hypothetical protein
MSAESLLPWRPPNEGEHMAKVDIVLVAGRDPYAWKGTEDRHRAHVRPDREGGCDRWCRVSEVAQRLILARSSSAILAQGEGFAAVVVGIDESAEVVGLRAGAVTGVELADFFSALTADLARVARTGGGVTPGRRQPIRSIAPQPEVGHRDVRAVVADREISMNMMRWAMPSAVPDRLPYTHVRRGTPMAA